MPTKNNTVFCVNHPDVPMVRNEGFNAITQVTKDGSNVSFNPSTGVPTVLFFCNSCGYIEMYAAAKTGLWK
jgi:hypothetical protein